MKRSVIFLVAAAFILAAPGIRTAFADDNKPADPPKAEKVGKTGSSAATKAMTKQDKTPKTMGNGADKAKVKTGVESKTTGAVK